MTNIIKKDIKVSKHDFHLEIYPALEGTEGTRFQEDLKTIKSILPNLDALSQVKLAKGLKLPMDKQDRIDYYFDILSKSPIYMYDPSAARVEANRLAEEEIGTVTVKEPTEDQSENLITNPTEEQYNNLKSGEQFIYNGQVLTKE